MPKNKRKNRKANANNKQAVRRAVKDALDANGRAKEKARQKRRAEQSRAICEAQRFGPGYTVLDVLTLNPDFGTWFHLEEDATGTRCLIDDVDPAKRAVLHRSQFRDPFDAGPRDNEQRNREGCEWLGAPAAKKNIAERVKRDIPLPPAVAEAPVVVIVGSGGSLRRELDRCRAVGVADPFAPLRREGGLVLTINDATNQLAHAGYPPDYVFTIDPTWCRLDDGVAPLRGAVLSPTSSVELADEIEARGGEVRYYRGGGDTSPVKEWSTVDGVKDYARWVDPLPAVIEAQWTSPCAAADWAFQHAGARCVMLLGIDGGWPAFRVDDKGGVTIADRYHVDGRPRIDFPAMRGEDAVPARSLVGRPWWTSSVLLMQQRTLTAKGWFASRAGRLLVDCSHGLALTTCPPRHLYDIARVVDRHGVQAFADAVTDQD